MNRINLLKELVSELKSIDEKNAFKYIGTGNPNADILIIGKEASISDNPEQEIMEIEKNLKDWDNITNKEPFL